MKDSRLLVPRPNDRTATGRTGSNTDKAGLDVTSPVGLFLRASQAELGIEDMAGNVWEWCASSYESPHANEPNAFRVLRGGSWFSNQDYARSDVRFSDGPDSGGDYIGFRVVSSSPIGGP